MVTPLKYPGWKCSFETSIDQKNIPPIERIHYLKKYLGGYAKEAVEGYFLLTTVDSYDEARALLEERYGDLFLVANAFRDKLDAWPKIPIRDGQALRKFTDFLRQCQMAMQTIGGLGILNDNREIRKLVMKVPDWAALQWARLVADWKERNRTFPPFREFTRFQIKEANFLCDPMTSIQSPKQREVKVIQVSSPVQVGGANLGNQTQQEPCYSHQISHASSVARVMTLTLVTLLSPN